MAGFYVHIPFCRQACRYCDFHFAVSLRYIPEMISAMQEEIKRKREIFGQFSYDSLYFGGGTPSVLKIQELVQLVESIFRNYSFNEGFEFTLEANPDDINREYARELKNAGVNRISIGIQSFIEKDLVLMRRSHTARQAITALDLLQNEGFENINADLIYGIPGMSSSEWRKNLDQFIEMDIPHLSAYHLTFEEGTVFDHWRKKGRITPLADEDSLEQFKILKNIAGEKGYIHYEISNFGKEDYFSRHNLVYWKMKPYIGIGPSAHSYDGKQRYWNRSNNTKYIELLKNFDTNYFEYEVLSEKDHYNEYILTSLRTRWGADLNQIGQRFGEHYVKYTVNILKIQQEIGLCEKHNMNFRLTEKGIFLADKVMRDFFMI